MKLKQSYQVRALKTFFLGLKTRALYCTPCMSCKHDIFIYVLKISRHIIYYDTKKNIYGIQYACHFNYCDNHWEKIVLLLLLLSLYNYHYNYWKFNTWKVKWSTCFCVPAYTIVYIYIIIIIIIIQNFITYTCRCFLIILLV